jgi:hypothetical protein
MLSENFDPTASQATARELTLKTLECREKMHGLFTGQFRALSFPLSSSLASVEKKTLMIYPCFNCMSADIC